jgi:ADP-ribose pyrophosphatase YjhB (NUDIX family)
MASTGCLSEEDYALVRASVPLPCVDLLPWRSAAGGVEVGLITRLTERGEPGYALVGGRVRHDETLAAALNRHVTETLGDGVAIGAVDTSLPLGVYEYFPDGRNGLVDPTKHAIALTYAAPLSGSPRPGGEASAFDWFPADALPPENAFGFGHGHVVRGVLSRLRRS